jgi:cardiolipin synthase
MLLPHITIPTYFTIIRILLTPVLIAFMMQEQWVVAFWVFIVAASTDLIDGALARFLNMHSRLGACLDALADKFLLVSVFLVIAFGYTPSLAIPRWFSVFVLCKELVLIVGVAALWLWQKTLVVKPTVLGKCTTLFQNCFVAWLFICHFFSWFPARTSQAMVMGMGVLLFASLVDYARRGFIIQEHRA